MVVEVVGYCYFVLVCGLYGGDCGLCVVFGEGCEDVVGM